MTILTKSVTIPLPKSFIIGLLISFYTLAFIITPYWTLPKSTAIRFIILLVIIGAGAAWCFFSGAGLRVRIDIKSLLFFFILLAGLFGINDKALNSAIPWRGDEPYHIAKAFSIGYMIGTEWFIFAALAFITFLTISWIKPKWTVYAAGFLVIGAVISTLYLNLSKELDSNYYLRYPFVTYWFAAIAPKAAMVFADPFHEILYRILPFLSATAIAWFFQRNLAREETLPNLLWALGVATMPIVFYYSSILYLELPVVFLMTVVCFRIKTLMYSDFTHIKQNPGWYALILIGFIKETTLPFLFCFLGMRWIVQLFGRKSSDDHMINESGLEERQPKRSFVSWLVGECGIAFSILLPIFLYLFLRGNLAGTRGYSIQIENLTNHLLYSAIERSLVDQFGLFLLFFFAGIILLIRKKELAQAAFLFLTFLGTLLFFALDRLIFVGYSRFNLLILPPILAASGIVLQWLSEQKKYISLGAACAVILISLFISPINMDGTKKPYWDSYNSDTAEHYYPYREAIYWLDHNYPEKRILFAGMTYDYYMGFYFLKYQWTPQYHIDITQNRPNDAAALADSLALAEKENDQIVLFHVQGKDIPQIENDGNFTQVKVFKNMAHILVLYKRDGP